MDQSWWQRGKAPLLFFFSKYLGFGQIMVLNLSCTVCLKSFWRGCMYLTEKRMLKYLVKKTLWKSRINFIFVVIVFSFSWSLLGLFVFFKTRAFFEIYRIQSLKVNNKMLFVCIESYTAITMSNFRTFSSAPCWKKKKKQLLIPVSSQSLFLPLPNLWQLLIYFLSVCLIGLCWAFHINRTA